MTAKSKKPPTSGDLNRIDVELRHAGDREAIVAARAKIDAHLRSLDIQAEYLGYIEFGRAAKRDFAQRLSTCLAQKLSDALRPKFRGILPDESGGRHESRSGSASGLKKLDVNYSNPQIGLGLAVSIKTLNFKDEGTGRFTKNIRRLDGELRAEAQDCHVRQPYSVLVGLIFFPEEAARDSGTKSSLRHAGKYSSGAADEVQPITRPVCSSEFRFAYTTPSKIISGAYDVSMLQKKFRLPAYRKNTFRSRM
jgi:hypothetical protein